MVRVSTHKSCLFVFSFRMHPISVDSYLTENKLEFNFSYTVHTGRGERIPEDMQKLQFIRLNFLKMAGKGFLRFLWL